MKQNRRFTDSRLREYLQLHLLVSSRPENVLTTVEVIAKGGKLLGTVRDASALGYYTVPSCEIRRKPVTDEELSNPQNFAQLRRCKRRFYLGGTKPCVPVFYRGTDIMSEFVEERSRL